VAVTAATGGSGVVELGLGGLLDGLGGAAGPAVDPVVTTESGGGLVLAAPVRPPDGPAVQPAVTASSAVASETNIQR
jgi:hypothetical protein